MEVYLPKCGTFLVARSKLYLSVTGRVKKLNIGAWVLKFGFTPTGYVAVVNSPPQILFRTAHTVSGMFLLASAVTLKFHWVRFRSSLPKFQEKVAALSEHSLTWEGGLQ